jgi:importin subunit beta-1
MQRKSNLLLSRTGQDPTFRQSAFEAISVLIEHSARDVGPVVQNLSTMVLTELSNTFAKVASIQSDEDLRSHYQYQSNLCSVFSSIVHYEPGLIRAEADPIVQILIRVIDGASKEATVREEAFTAIGAVAGAEVDFLRYMQTLMPYFMAALNNHEDHALCAIVLGVLGDVCRALGENMFPFCDTLISQIGNLLNNPTLHRKIRPACLTAIGDISLAIGGQFEVYVHPAMQIIGNIANQLAYIPQVGLN